MRDFDIALGTRPNMSVTRGAIATISNDGPSARDAFLRYRDRGDAAAFAEIFDRTAPALLGVARRLARRRADAEDLVQAMFVTAIGRAHTFDSGRPLVPWLPGILAGHARNAARRAARTEHDELSEIAVGRDVLESIVDLERCSAVALAVRDLPEPHRGIVSARLSGMDAGDVSPGTLRVRFHRAVVRLRRTLPQGLFSLLPIKSFERARLDPMRRALIARAERSSIPLASTRLLIFGGILVQKKWIVAAVGLLLVAAAPFEFTSRGHESPVVPAASPIAAPEIVESIPGVAATIDSSATSREAVTPELSKFPIVVRGRALDATTRARLAGVEAVFASSTNRVLELRSRSRPSGDDGIFETRLEYVPEMPEIHLRALDHAPLHRQVFTPGEIVARRDGIDLGDFLLDVGTTLRGIVRDAKGGPVAGARILLNDVGFDMSRSYLAVARDVGATTDDGTFEVEHVRPSANFYHHLFAVAASGCGGLEFTLASGRETLDGIVLQLLQPSPVEIEVVDEMGKPLQDATIVAVPADRPFTGAAGECLVSARADLPCSAELFRTTDANGKAHFEALPAGTAVVVAAAMKDGVDYRESNAKIPKDSPTRDRSIRIVLAPVPASPSSTTPPDTMPKLPIAGIVVDDAGAPVPDARVFGQCGTKWLPGRGAPTDAEGRFVLAEATADTTTVQVQLPGGWCLWRWTMLEQSVTPGAQDLRLVGERTPEGRATITIDVFDAASRAPLALCTADVWSRIHDGTPPRFGGPEPYLSAGAKGRIRFDKWRAGSWRIQVRPDGAPQATFDFEVGPTDTALHFDFPIAQSASVTGHIVADGIDDAAFEKALQHASIWGCEGDGSQAYSSNGEWKPMMLPLNGQRDFRFESVGPRKIRFRLFGNDIIGEARLDARKGGNFTIELHAVIAGRIHLRGVDPYREGDPILHLVPQDASDLDSDRWFRPKFTMEPDQAHDTLTILPGALRYEIYGEGGYFSDYEFSCRNMRRIATGVITVKSGETGEIDMPAR